MTSDAIPQLQPDVPSAPHDLTRTYFDNGQAFGSRQAAPRDDVPPAPEPTSWTDARIAQAAEIGARFGVDLTVDAIEQVCRRYLALTAELVGERSEVVRLGRLLVDLSRQRMEVARQHALLSAENLQLRRIARDRAEWAVVAQNTSEPEAAETLRWTLDDDTKVVDMTMDGGGR